MSTRFIVRSAGIGLALALAASAASAHGPRVGVSIDIRVPARIETYHAHDYRPYTVGHVYFAPHRHAHVVYAFPVRGRYVPHVYCGGALIRTGYVPTFDPRYDDYGAGYRDVVWDGVLDPSYVGVSFHARSSRWDASRSYRTYEHRYHDNRTCDHDDDRRGHGHRQRHHGHDDDE